MGFHSKGTTKSTEPLEVQVYGEHVIVKSPDIAVSVRESLLFIWQIGSASGANN